MKKGTQSPKEDNLGSPPEGDKPCLPDNLNTYEDKIEYLCAVYGIEKDQSGSLRTVFPELTQEKTFKKQEVVGIIDKILEFPDNILDAIYNENTNFDGNELIKLAGY